MRRNRERGVQVVELAVTLPLLCLFLFAITDGADFVRTHVILNNAAREGARMGASTYCPGCATTYVQNYVEGYVMNYINSETNGRGIGPNGKDGWCSASAFSSSNITVNPVATYTYTDPTLGSMQASATQVTISYPYTFCYVSGFARIFGFGNLSKTMTLGTGAIFRNLY